MVTAQVGRLLVFESGAVKLQMGDVLLDVAPGNPSAIRQARGRALCCVQLSLLTLKIRSVCCMLTLRKNWGNVFVFVYLPSTNSHCDRMCCTNPA